MNLKQLYAKWHFGLILLSQFVLVLFLLQFIFGIFDGSLDLPTLIAFPLTIILLPLIAGVIWHKEIKKEIEVLINFLA